MILDKPQSEYDKGYNGQLLNGEWPRPGFKLCYKGTHIFWFANIIEDAEKNLVVGNIYTLAKISLASSWTAVTLEENGETVYSLSFFEVVEKVSP
jgi:hypothetical protein